MITLDIEEALFILFDSKGADRPFILVNETLYTNWELSSDIKARELFCVDRDELGNYQLWQRKYHKVSTEQALRRKVYENRQRDLRLIKGDASKRVADKIKDLVGDAINIEMATALARRLINTKNVNKLKEFGIDVATEEWKELFDEN